MSGNTCDVCGKSPSIGVGASTCGPVSFAYCRSCAESGAEPYGALVAYLSCAVSSGESLRPEAHQIRDGYQLIIDASLSVAGKTREEFYDDAQRLIDEFDAAMIALEEEDCGW